MTSTVVLWGRASPLVVVAVVLCCGNAILQVADAFQTRTTSLRPISRSSQSGAIVQPFQMNYRQPRRLFLTVASPESATNTTSTDESVSLAAELEEKAVSDAFFVPMLDEESVTTSSIGKRGRKRRAIQRMKENRFSRPIDSRLVRTLLFPMRMLIWNPLWIVMDIFIARLDEEMEATVLDSEDIKDSTGVSTNMKYEDLLLDTTKTEDTTDESSDDSASEVVDSGAPETVVEEEVVAVDDVDTPPEMIVNEDVVAIEDIDDSAADAPDISNDMPSGDRWATATPGVDLSGKWELIVTDDFKVEYDKYLAGLGQPKIVRSVALSGPVIGQTMEELIQIDGGKSLLIRGKNIRGTWDRTLVASGSTTRSPDFEPLITPIPTVDQEIVQCEAWWEDQGKSHVSWMRGVTMYTGGSFYSKRYMEEKENENDEDVYVSEGFFEFDDPKKERNELTW
eukprot:CAMPEP_0116095572 /NCGR_PEP_ID=MMETSP0327-20121206/9734_1 /TAXON_ID=44447 /ORGANISM="Pseudo-nitzschia delicatissima, Strain B596" /LENGTH=451 /DNA_ID=CAMNT_0003587247 /DNA_START=290 /DNA_END=1642 /DNA_ORIENTATION=+